MASSPLTPSHRHRPTRATTPAPSSPDDAPPQPDVPDPSTRAKVRRQSPAVARSPPNPSIVRVASIGVTRTKRVRTSAAAAIGRLTRKIDRQPTASISHPPRTGPRPAVAAPIAAQAPIARPRAGPSKASLRIARLFGISMAAPRPCAMRPRIRRSSVGAAAQTAEESPKRPIPSAKIRRRPNRSPRAPPSKTSALSGRR